MYFDDQSSNYEPITLFALQNSNIVIVDKEGCINKLTISDGGLPIRRTVNSTGVNVSMIGQSRVPLCGPGAGTGGVGGRVGRAFDGASSVLSGNYRDGRRRHAVGTRCTRTAVIEKFNVLLVASQFHQVLGTLK